MFSHRTGQALAAPAVMLAIGLLAGCGSTTEPAAPAGTSASAGTSAAAAPETSAATPPESSAAAMIHIMSFKYDLPASVSPGATVQVMNMDGEAHTVTADSGPAFDVSAPPGEVVSFTAPTKPGTYPFHCTFHSNMHGTLVVK